MTPGYHDVPVVHPQILAIRRVGEEPADMVDDNIDVHVWLRDGRSFSFTVFTIENLRRNLDSHGGLSFVSPGMLVVRVLTDAAIVEAVTEAVVLGIEQFGIEQR